jgi:hypothetical protein
MRASPLLLLAFLSLGATAITDCELCKIITEIYGGCSPELVANYANMTGIKDVEWKCLNDHYIPPPEGASYEVSPIHTISLMNYTIGIYSNEKNAYVYPSHNFREWGYSLDNENNSYVWINFDTSQKTYFEIQSFGLSRNNSKFGNSTFFIDFSNSTAITSISSKSSGYVLNLTPNSKTGFYNITIKIGKLDACIIGCGSPTDEIYITTYTSGATGVLIGNFFTYMGEKWKDYERTCTVLGCYLCPQTNAPSGTWAQIPITDNTKPLDTDGVSTNNCKLSPARDTVYYLYPQCNLVSSGRYVRAQLSVWLGAQHSFSCINPTTPTTKTLITEDDDEDIKKPQFPYYYALAPLGVMAIGYAYVKKEGQNAT